MKITADRYYDEVFTLDIATDDDLKHVYMTKREPWFWGTDENAYESTMFSYHYSPIYPISISGMYQLDDYPFSVGLMFGSSTGFYGGWFSNHLIVLGKYEKRKGLLGYSELYDPNQEAELHESNCLLLANMGYRPCNGITLELGLGFVHSAEKYYMDNAYYRTEYTDNFGGWNLATTRYVYEQTDYSQWYEGKFQIRSFASRIGTKIHIPLDYSELLFGCGWIWTPELQTKHTRDISIGYNFIF